MGTRMNKGSPGAGIWACCSSTPSALRHSWDAADAWGTAGGQGGGRASRDRAVSEVLRVGGGPHRGRRGVHPHPRRPLLPSPDDNPRRSLTHWLSPGNSRQHGRTANDGAQVGTGHGRAQAAGAPGPASPLWGPLPKLGRAEKRQCSLDIPRQNSWGAAPPHSGTAPAGRERAARQVPAGRRGAARAPVPTSPTGGEGRALRQAGNGGQEIHCERGRGVNPGSMAPYPAKASYWKARPLGG